MLLYSNLYFSKLTGWFNSSSSANIFSCACHKERILQDKIEREERNKVAAATRQKRRQGFKEEKKRFTSPFRLGVGG
jgi:hypothetical protein